MKQKTIIKNYKASVLNFRVRRGQERLSNINETDEMYTLCIE